MEIILSQRINRWPKQLIIFSLTQLKVFKPDDTVNEGLDDINKIVSKFKNHPSIIKIKQKN